MRECLCMQVFRYRRGCLAGLQISLHVTISRNTLFDIFGSVQFDFETFDVTLLLMFSVYRCIILPRQG